MKTAEEWSREYNPTVDNSYSERFIAVVKQIQLDAFCAGLTEAAEIARSKEGVHKLSGIVISNEILTARDNKTTL